MPETGLCDFAVALVLDVVGEGVEWVDVVVTDATGDVRLPESVELPQAPSLRDSTPALAVAIISFFMNLSSKDRVSKIAIRISIDCPSIAHSPSQD